MILAKLKIDFLTLGKLLILLLGEIVVGEVCSWGSLQLMKLLLGKFAVGEVTVGEVCS